MEIWRNVQGYEGFYEVSDAGHVRSIDRTPDEARELTPDQFRRLMDGFAVEGTIKEVFSRQPNLENNIMREESGS